MSKSRRKNKQNRDLYVKPFTDKAIMTDCFSYGGMGSKLYRRKEKRALKAELHKAAKLSLTTSDS